MSQENKIETEDKIRIVEAEANAEQQPAVRNQIVSAHPAGEKSPTPNRGTTLDATNKAGAEKLLKELPTDEFLHLLDQSSPEQLQAFLQALGPTQQPFLQIIRNLIGHVINIPDEPRGAFSIIAWWESRRILFNLIVGLCGLPTLAIIYLLGLANLGLVISGTIEYGLLANICYTAGWICELVARSWWKERAKHLGPILFSLGFAFSMLLTLGAGLICIMIFVLLGLLR